MPYATVTRDAAVAVIADRLNDPSKKFWTEPEIIASLTESLRILNCLTGNDRARGAFATSDGISLYQLSTVLRDQDDVLLRPQTVTSSDLVTEVRYHLVESTATPQFTSDQIESALERRRDQFLADTSSVVVELPIDVSPGDGVVDLPDGTISVRRAMWRTADGRCSTLSSSDEFTSLALGRGAITQSRPRTYSVSAVAGLQLRLLPPPSTAGVLELLVTRSGPTFPATVSVAQDYVFVVKWGAIADLLSDAESVDPERADAANRLCTFGAILAKAQSTILAASIDGVLARPAAVHLTDRLRSGWQGRRRSKPDTLSVAGPDTVMLTPVPDFNSHTVTLDVVRNAQIPIDGDAFLQVAPDQVETVYLFALWTLMFKRYDTETSVQVLASALRSATAITRRNRAASSAIHVMYGIGKQQEGAHPTESAADPSLSSGADPSESSEIQLERNARRRTGQRRGF